MNTKTYLFALLACFLLSISLCCCIHTVRDKKIKGSGTQVSASPQVSGSFDAISVEDAIAVELTQASPFTLRVEGDDNIVKLLIIKVENGTLKLHLPDGSYSDFKLRVFVSSPTLSEISLDEASSLTTSSLVAENLKIQIDAASTLTIDSLSAKDLHMEIDAASSAKIRRGKVDKANINIDAASQFRGSGLTIGCASLSVDAASMAEVKALSFDVLEVQSASTVVSYMYNEERPPIVKKSNDETSMIEFRDAN